MDSEMDAFNKENNLATLTGSDKQIAWANKIRKNFMVLINSSILNRKANVNEEILLAIERFKRETESSFFIDHRDTKTLQTILWQLHEQRLREIIENETRNLGIVADAEIVLTPKETICKDPVRILVQVGLVIARFRKHEKVNELFKRHRYRWDNNEKYWVIKTQSETDRAAELAARLLNMGVPVIMHNEESRYKLETRSFEIANHKVIGTNAEETLFIVNFPYDKNIEKILESTLNGNVYSKGRIAIKKAFTDDLIDFAEEYGFRFNPYGAKLRDSTPRKINLIVDTDDLSDLLDD